MPKIQKWSNAQIARDLGVSAMTITRYIQRAKKGQNKLVLVQIGDKFTIPKTPQNLEELRRLAGVSLVVRGLVSWLFKS
ncbi:MAG: sigma factor-like helix-turn-helix DNA-binding protein [Fusobacteriaceae bacterium]